MKLLTILFLSASAFADQSDTAKQLDDAKAENAELRQKFTELQAQESRAISAWTAAFVGGMNQCIGQQVQPPVPKSDPKPQPKP